MFVRNSLFALVLGLGLGLVACAAPTEGDDATEANASSEDELRTTTLAGTYEIGIGTANALDLDKLTLKSNHTFTALKGKKHSAGTWSNAKSQLTLTTTGETRPTTLYYSVSGAILRVSATYHGKYSLFFKDGVAFPKVDIGEVCSDKIGNIIAECPENFACNFDGSNSKLQRCWPDF